MWTMHDRLQSWQRYQTASDQERDRVAECHRPIAKTPEHIIAPTKIRRVGRGFLIGGKEVQMGETVTVPANVAKFLVGINKAEYV